MRLIAPGRRKGNRYWLYRGWHAGRLYEISTRARDQAGAERVAAAFLARLGQRHPSAPLSFAEAAALYLDWRRPAAAEVKRLARLVEELGPRPVAGLRQADLVAAANALAGHVRPATRNREVLRPAAAVLHYAADNGHCPWLRVRLFREPAPATQALSRPQAAALIAAAGGKRRLLLAWLFGQGTRLGDTLRLEAGQIDLARRTARLYIGKSGRWTEAPLHDDVAALLAADPDLRRGAGRLFPWRARSGVYRWLRPLAARLGLRFTPHMARHSIGAWLAAEGVGLRAIMDKLGHRDPKSSIRYQSTDLPAQRAANRKLGRLAGGG